MGYTAEAERLCEPPRERDKPEKAELHPWSAPHDVRLWLLARDQLQVPLYILHATSNKSYSTRCARRETSHNLSSPRITLTNYTPHTHHNLFQSHRQRPTRAEHYPRILAKKYCSLVFEAAVITSFMLAHWVSTSGAFTHENMAYA
jgi:hypothetical protein